MRDLTAKLVGTAILALCALFAAVRCVDSFPDRRQSEPVSYDGAKAEYVLRDWKGYVSVFAPDSERDPLQVTDIETASLRVGDRAMLEGGLTVGSREQLLLLLEDLGN